MSFFNYHMPPFLTVMGAFYILVAAPILINLVRSGYWNGVFQHIIMLIRNNILFALLAFIIVLGIIHWIDLPLAIWVKQIDNIIHAYTFWDFVCSCAEGGFVVGLLFTLAMLAEYFYKHKLSIVCKIGLMSSIYGGLINTIFKFIFNRQRPSLGLEQWYFFAFFESGATHFDDLMYAYNSMPSGHTITTVAALVPFFMAYRNNALRCLLILWWLMVCFSRVYTLNHWLSDVTVASVFGLVIGLAVYRANQTRINHEI